MRFLLGPVAVAGLVMSIAPGSVHASPTFNLTYISGTTAQAQTAFAQAAGIWSSLFTDSVTIDLTVGTGSLSSGILASASSTQTSFSYMSFRNAMIADATSVTDASAVANLPTSSSFKVYINYTSDNPNGVGSATPYLDATGAGLFNNNIRITITNANAKALGLPPVAQTVTGCAGACDGFIQFSSALTYDYDRSNGITGGAYDFVGLAIHEIGHALGFISGVDVLDTNAPDLTPGGGATNGYYPADVFQFVSPLDMFRCSANAVSAGADLDFTADSRAKSVSFNECATTLGTFSTGLVHGDGRQASHWKDGLGLGVMDPTASLGELLNITPLDKTGLDAIGWNLAVPEPATLAIGSAWLLGMAAIRRRRVA